MLLGPWSDYLGPVGGLLVLLLVAGPFLALALGWITPLAMFAIQWGPAGFFFTLGAVLRRALTLD